MDARELRLGNAVWEDYSGYMIVTAINSITNDNKEDFISLAKTEKLPSAAYQSRLIKPIPLMEDLLLMCGFAMDEDFGYQPSLEVSYEIYRYNGFSIGRNEKGEWYRWDENDEDKWYSGFVGKEIKHLHQLQNIYYVLQEEELPVNL